MKRCCLCGRAGVQFHHNLIVAGRQVDDPAAILPLCPGCHKIADDTLIKEELDLYMFVHKKLDPADYPRSGLVQRKKYLIKKYGY